MTDFAYALSWLFSWVYMAGMVVHDMDKKGIGK